MSIEPVPSDAPPPSPEVVGPTDAFKHAPEVWWLLASQLVLVILLVIVLLV